MATVDAGLHEQRRTMLGAFALGALDDHERRQVDVHLSHCPLCREELAVLVTGASRLTGGGGDDATAQLWERIRGRLHGGSGRRVRSERPSEET